MFTVFRFLVGLCKKAAIIYAFLFDCILAQEFGILSSAHYA
jgi:hypothetical protein